MCAKRPFTLLSKGAFTLKEREHESAVAFFWVLRKSNVPFTLIGGNNQTIFAFAQCQCTLTQNVVSSCSRMTDDLISLWSAHRIRNTIPVKHTRLRVTLTEKSICHSVKVFHCITLRQILVCAPKLNKRNAIHFNLSHLQIPSQLGQNHRRKKNWKKFLLNSLILL